MVDISSHSIVLQSDLKRSAIFETALSTANARVDKLLHHFPDLKKTGA